VKRIGTIAPGLLLCSVVSASAQGSSPSLDQVARALTPEVRIQVLDQHRGKIEGRFRGVSGSMLRLVVNGQVVEVPEAQVFQVRKERREPDGVLLGLGIGFAAGFSYVLMYCDRSSEHADCMRAGSVVFAGPAAAAGALIDHFSRHFDTVFERRVSSTGRWHVWPIVDARRKGVQMRVRF
jgi:hypothetical protein